MLGEPKSGMCPGCKYPEPADWCWEQRLRCPLKYPPRDIDLRRLLTYVNDLENRIEKLENPPCCAGGPQWGHAMNCPNCPD